MRPVAAVVLAALAIGCARDTSLPPPPAPPGRATLSGRIVYSQPGTATRLAAAGARVELLGSGRVALADADGKFLLPDLEIIAGQLLAQFDPGATGVPTRQRVLDLGAFAGRAGVDLSVGDVLVNENARVRGRALRGDAAGPGGHAGTVVYVPQGPFTTFTNDDGSFELRDLPEGSIDVAAFRTGYQSVAVSGISLRGAEDLALRDLVLPVLTGGGTGDPGQIRGRVLLDPPAAGATTVTAADGAGRTFSAAAAADGSFAVDPVPPGVFAVTFTHDGYLPAIVSNVAVAPGAAAVLADVRLVPDALASCAAGTACLVPGEPCRRGTMTCGAAPACAPAGNAIDGTPCGAGLVCRAGACLPPCDAGRICAPANPCHVGVVVCAADGTATCQDTLAVLPDGSACRPGESCDAGVCTPCAGAGCGACSLECVPANPCHVGARTCAAGSPCVDTGILVADGAGCGTNAVCLAGACGPCAAGTECQGPSACRAGIVSCATGESRCVEGAARADGTPCGSGDVCRAGACVPGGGLVSTPVPPAGTSPSFRHVQVASNGDVYFVDWYAHTVNAWVASASTVVVVAGRRNQAGASADNQPATSASLYYPDGLALDEPAGLLYVADTYNDRIRAIELGGNRWIRALAGGGSVPGPGYGDGGPPASATLARPEALGLGAEGGRRFLYFFDSSHARFRKIDLSPGGVISAWDVPASCSGPVAVNGCPAPLCSLVSAGAGGMFLAGSVCGTEVGAVTRGIVRVPPGGGRAVHVAGRSPGVTSDGASARQWAFADVPGLALDAAGNLYAASMAANRVVRFSPFGAAAAVAGTGAAATLDGPTALAASFDGPSSLGFHRGVDAWISDQRSNALRSVVNLGTALYEPASLGSASPLSRSVLVGQPVPPDPLVILAARLRDAAGGALAGFDVEAAISPAPATGYLLATTALTDAGGVASFGARAGLAPGTYGFDVSFRDLLGNHVPGSPLRFEVAAAAPPPGTILTAVNEERNTTAPYLIPGFGPVARVATPAGVAAASDGTAYFSSFGLHAVLALAPDGALSVVAGTLGAGGGATGDGGPATEARLYYPQGIALDEAGRRLFVADTYGHRIRTVHLDSGLIETIAGTGAVGSAGDGGPAALATFAYPGRVRLHGNRLYVADTNSDRIRAIDLAADPPTIDPVLSATTVCGAAIVLWNCGADPGCDVAFDASDRMYVSGSFCGGPFAGTPTSAVVRRDGTALTRIAGNAAGATGDAIYASQLRLGSAPALAFGPGGRLFLAEASRLRWLDLSGTPMAYLLAGSGTAGYAGSYVDLRASPATVLLSGTGDLAFGPGGHAWIADRNNHALRLVWDLAGVLP